MELMTRELEARIPRLHETEGLGGDAVAQAHFFAPFADKHWYMTEYDPKTGTCFGAIITPMTREYHDGFEWGYFTLKEMEDLNAGHDHPLAFVERDEHFEPDSIDRIVAEDARAHARDDLER